MKTFLHAFLLGLVYFAIASTAQTQPAADTVSAQSHGEKGLFDADAILEIILSGNMRELLNDRAEESKYHPVNLLYKGEDGSKVVLATEVKTRGHFRKLRENCFYPPLLINFSKNDSLRSSVFKEQNKLKLVMPCKDDQYIIREWLVYKLYNLVTPKSFKARLVSVKLNDTRNGKISSPFYGILLEEEKQMAKRNAAISLNKRIEPQQAEREDFLNMAVFEYLIGNTDWCVQYQQNIKLLAADSNAVPVTVPYDFDHAGLVDAPYALPAEELKMNSIRERRYRGFCMEDMKAFDSTVALYNRLKKDIYSIYNGCSLLDAKYIKTTVRYFDEFYATINNPVALQKEFGYPCDKYGTGNVLIKGLRDD